MTQFARITLPFIALLSAAALTYVTGLPQILGAHPWWADKVIVLGVPIGIGLATTAWALRISRPARLIGFSLLTLAAFGIAHSGKLRFAASYAEDMLAGQAWYFGWIATCALAAATLASVFRYHRQRR